MIVLATDPTNKSMKVGTKYLIDGKGYKDGFNYGN